MLDGSRDGGAEQTIFEWKRKRRRRFTVKKPQSVLRKKVSVYIYVP